MSCTYSHDAGRFSAINQFHKKINELLERETSIPSTSLAPAEYWRHVGKQDVLLELLSFINSMVGLKV